MASTSSSIPDRSKHVDTTFISILNSTRDHALKKRSITLTVYETLPATFSGPTEGYSTVGTAQDQLTTPSQSASSSQATPTSGSITSHSTLSTSEHVRSSTSASSHATTKPSSPTTTPPDHPSNNSDSGIKPEDQNILDTGRTVGISIAGVISLALIFILVILWRRRRLKTTRLARWKLTTTESGHIEQELPTRKGESDRIKPQIFGPKSELGNHTECAELEGTPIEARGAGIYVQKPELEGTQGDLYTRGLYVIGKHELEVR
ncbi:hypothetical protein GGR57DRAFT_513386 [Xylariaceae sp. FL1272]|nr:hypothetical protein GGR57DRAFT_513386 [Xylariaceae sp. FL1272]